MLFAVPAAYALGRLRYPAKRASGFYMLATQMLPPVGLIIPYYLVLQKIGALDTYSGLTVIYLTFSLPFAIWLMVSYFEDVPLEMEEAALLDRAGPAARAVVRDPAAGARRHRGDDDLRLPQRVERVHVRGRARRQPRAAGDRRDVQLHLGRADAMGEARRRRDARDAPVILIGFFAQRHIVKGLTVGAVKGGGRR